MSSARRVYLDSSIFIGAALPGSNHSISTREFCQRLAAERAIVVYSVIMRYEYAHIARGLASPDDRRYLPPDIVAMYDLENWEADAETRRRWMVTVEENLDRLLNQFAYFVEVPIRSEMWSDTLEVMIQHRLRSYDALHVASARYFRVGSLASCDRHFIEVDDLDVTIIRDSR